MEHLLSLSDITEHNQMQHAFFHLWEAQHVIKELV